MQFELRDVFDMPGPWCSRKSPCFQILLWTFKFELVESVIGHYGVAMGMTNVGLVVVHLCAIDIKEERQISILILGQNESFYRDCKLPL